MAREETPEEFYYSDKYDDYVNFKISGDNITLMFGNGKSKTVTSDWFKKLQKIEDAEKLPLKEMHKPNYQYKRNFFTS